MNKEKYNSLETLNYNYFYNLFLKRRMLYPMSYFLFPTFSRKKKQPVSKKLHKKIIDTYLDCYFKDFYNEKVSLYFPLSGRLIKARGKTFIFKTLEQIGVAWIWYQRPSIVMFSNVKIQKMKGSTGKVNVLDKKYKEKHDINLLESVSFKFRRMIQLKTLVKK